jgi:hypothetical protein
MRSIACIALAGALAGSAFAQEPVVVEGALADAVKSLAHGQTLNSGHARALNSAAMSSGGLDLGEKALFDKLATGGPVEVAIGGSNLILKPDADARRIAGMLTGKIDTPAIWADDARIGELVEMSRWAPVTWDAATLAAGGPLYAARLNSSQANSYGPFRILLDQKWKAIQMLPEADAREAGRAMLFRAVELVQEQSRKSYIELPGFVYLWLDSEETKASIK